MKKFLLLFIIFLSFNAYSDNKISFRLYSDLNYSPFFYEDGYNAFLTALSSSIMTGIRYNFFTFGLETTDNYLSYNGQNNEKKLTGAFNILNFNFVFYYMPSRFFELKSGMGAGWFKSAFEYNNTGVISKNEAGISFLLCGLFAFPFKYINLEQNNVIAVFFTEIYASPFYTGTIRMNVKPYFEWMNLYFEIGIKTFFYNTSENDIKTAMFVWSIGTSFNINFPDVTRKIKKQRINSEEIIDNKNSDVTNDIMTKKIEIYPEESNSKEIKKDDNKVIEEKNENNISENKKEKTKYEILKETIIGKYENSKVGDVNLEYISFSKNNDVLGEESFTILDGLVEILKLKKDFMIAIGGYSIFFDNPTLEIEYAKEKALAIKRYLEKKGVPKEKIKIMASGRVYSKNESEKNRKIEIKILKK